MSAAATITTTNETIRPTIPTELLPRESENTSTPAGIAEAFDAIEVTAITATPSPICSDRAETKNATTPQATTREGNGVSNTASGPPSERWLIALIDTCETGNSSPAAMPR